MKFELEEAPGPQPPAGSALNETQSVSEAAVVPTGPAVPPATGGDQWDGRRLLLSFGGCALLVFAAVIFETCG